MKTMWVAGSYKHSCAHQQGFSLLEMMIVIMVIGILYALAGSMLNLSMSDPLNEEVTRLRERVLMAQDESIVRSQALALGFGETGYAFFAQNDQLQWEALDKDGLLKAHAWSGGYEQVLYLQGQAVSLPDNDNIRPQVFILPTGEMMPFEWHLRDNTQREQIVMFDNVGREVARAAEAN
ncbi:prepilin-type N-terminal cleavage/methylation domain-containing protein [Thiothrix subterranea]|uniref:GspH/FimT family pseudopilin n=1 Tax=Thiothrix subterranea TaxID=2735563 RepID=UPI00192C8074|nr:GspH/FimT family pseudopilin [Thiothrix subterranea]QQZ29438.1 prepilin-type N-terminal cleavage/methylation domain-containing protein [Thiothrix subterranea]